jgi:hypothetical protein
MNEAFLSSKLWKQAAPIGLHLVRALGAATRHGEAGVPGVPLPLRHTCEQPGATVPRLRCHATGRDQYDPMCWKAAPRHTRSNS